MKPLLAGLAGAVLGAVLLVAFRVAFAGPPPPTHHHANFAIFVDGRQVDLSGAKFMEDVTACYHGAVSPRGRVHLHNGEGDVVHVHHEGATWGHLLANLGMAAGKAQLVLDDGRVLVDGQGGTLKWVRNGRAEPSLFNDAIRSGDRVVISFGPETEAEVIARQFPAVPSNAEEYNDRPDPASCSGDHEATFGERLRHAITG